jgi:ankyrin repeat/BTB/POZ domain-containing protein 1
MFAKIISYIYQEKCELSVDCVYDVLFTADMYLLPSLKQYCAIHMVRYIDMDNVVQMIRTARMFQLAKLEDACSEYIAENLDEKILHHTDFQALVEEDAGNVVSRHETDSIPIIDDIRCHLTDFVQTFSDVWKRDQKLGLIDLLLQQLGLDA